MFLALCLCARARVSLYFVHIPKTGGMSFKNDFPPLLKKYAPGVAWSTSEKCAMPPADATHLRITLFRNPVAHVLSQFYQKVLYRPGGAIDGKLHKLKADPLAKLSKWLGVYANNTDVKTRDFQEYDPRNMQTRYLTCDLGGKPHHQTHVWGIPKREQPRACDAVGNLGSIAVGGLTELYTESMCCMLAAVAAQNKSLPRFCGCAHRNESKLQHVTHKNEHAVNADNLTALDMQLMGAVTEEDRELYLVAVDRFLRYAERVQRDRAVELLCESAEELRARLTSLFAISGALPTRIPEHCNNTL